MVIFPRAARLQSASPYTKEFQCRTGAARFTLADTVHANGASRLDCKLQYWTGSAWADLATPAEGLVDFVQIAAVGTQTLTVGPVGPAEELTTAPTLSALCYLPRVLRAVATQSGGGGGDSITFALSMEELGI